VYKHDLSYQIQHMDGGFIASFSAGNHNDSLIIGLMRIFSLQIIVSICQLVGKFAFLLFMYYFIFF
jgi:hypothetical protein